ncbi:hypothetical protein L3Q82_003326 [Scortum barcoo]|uniref:Uncharacterized protein n=1 Tax=Scortum barcoo TaxID=214431 RepID=A0ACB8VMD9_9TELE|nr:hypothetical protein L3Q82_003326 [Scortum barcoo]
MYPTMKAKRRMRRLETEGGLRIRRLESGSDEDQSDLEGAMGGYDPAVRRMLAKAEKRGSGILRRKEPEDDSSNEKQKQDEVQERLSEQRRSTVQPGDKVFIKGRSVTAKIFTILQTARKDNGGDLVPMQILTRAEYLESRESILSIISMSCTCRQINKNADFDFGFEIRVEEAEKEEAEEEEAETEEEEGEVPDDASWEPPGSLKPIAA